MVSPDEMARETGVGGMCGSDEERRGRRRREVEGENGKERWEEKKSLVKRDIRRV